MNYILPLDERPPAFPPDTSEQPAPGEAQATTGQEPSTSPPPRGGPSLVQQRDAIGVHVRLVGVEYLEVYSALALVNESTGAVIMRVPVADLLLQIDALKAAALDLQRMTGRRAKP